MAPALTEAPATAPHKLSAVPLDIFPDGHKTSGQHPPLYDQLKPFEKFPEQISGPTVWKAEDYRNNPEKWTHRFSEEEIEEFSTAADNFIAAKIPLTGITKVSSSTAKPQCLAWTMKADRVANRQTNFPLPKLESYLFKVKDDLINGKGFILFKGWPVQKWGNHKSAVAYMGLGTYLGYFVSQNSRGHVLGHVKDLGEDSSQIDKVRIYRTNARYVYTQSTVSADDVQRD